MRTILIVPILAILAGLASPTEVSAQSNGRPFVHLEKLILALSGLVQNGDATLGGKIDSLIAKVDAANGTLDSIDAKLDSLALAGGLVPFTAQAGGGICNTAGSPSANPSIAVDSDGDGPFVITSILVRTAPQGLGEEGYQYFSINGVKVNGSFFATRTDNLTAPVDGYGVQESTDLMGTPIRRSSIASVTPKGGNFPHQIVATSVMGDDVVVRLFCRADDFDLDIDAVAVSGWKAPSETITATYLPGT